MKNNRIEKLVMTGLMTALVAVVTIIIPIPIPFTGEYIHLGDSMIFLSVIILGWKGGAFAAAVGSAFADIYLSYVYWAPWTFVIKGGMALILGLIIYQSAKSKSRFTLTCVIVIAFWLAFNFIVRAVIDYEQGRNAAILMEHSGAANASEFGDFLSQIQSWLMISSLAIPLLLVIAAIVFVRSKKMPLSLPQILGMSGSGIFMVFGYYIAGGIIYGNFAVEAFTMPFNILQFVTGFVIAALISAGLSKTPLRRKMAFYASPCIKNDESI